MELIQIYFDFEKELKEFGSSFEWDEIINIIFLKKFFLKNICAIFLFKKMKNSYLK